MLFVNYFETKAFIGEQSLKKINVGSLISVCMSIGNGMKVFFNCFNRDGFFFSKSSSALLSEDDLILTTKKDTLVLIRTVVL
jgi:hypothetical protein